MASEKIKITETPSSNDSYSKSFVLGNELMEFIFEISDDLKRLKVKNNYYQIATELKVEKEFEKIYKAFDAVHKLKNRNKKSDGIYLDKDEKGKVVQSIENFVRVLKEDAQFKDIRFNEFKSRPEITINNKVEQWTDYYDSWAQMEIESKYNLSNKQKFFDALNILFKDREYHPVKALIEEKEWDGVERCSSFLNECLKCKDDEYTKEVSRLIFAGGINRLYYPGCKFDDMAVLMGKQGTGKSSIVSWLALNDEYFSEITEFEGQKGVEALEGSWVCEVGELLALTKVKDVLAVKSFITRKTDKYRKPYARRVEDVPRTNIFIGTTNEDTFLIDKTGNRRYYPVKVNITGYDLFSKEDEVKEYILNCWREAKAKIGTEFMKPVANVLLLDVIKEQQANVVEEDYREGLIGNYLLNLDSVCILEVWEKALQGEFTKPTPKESKEIGQILSNLDNWEKQPKAKRFGKYGVQKWWKRVSQDVENYEEFGEPFDS